MKRDARLVRRILLAIEEADGTVRAEEIADEDFSEEEVAYHLKIMGEKGIVRATRWLNNHKHIWTADRLTWEGADLLDAIRDGDRFEEAVARLEEEIGSAPFSLIVAACMAID